jgi:hypothetical protein
MAAIAYISWQRLAHLRFSALYTRFRTLLRGRQATINQNSWKKLSNGLDLLVDSILVHAQGSDIVLALSWQLKEYS